MSRTQVDTRVATLDESVILDNENFQDELAALASEIGLNQEQAEERARKCLEELAVRPEERYLGWHNSIPIAIGTNIPNLELNY